jgi:fluoroquinolone transport system permease protein
MSVRLLDLYRALGPVDAKNIRRDPLLAWVGILPFVLALAYRLIGRFDLGPYQALIASSFVTAAPGMAGMVAGFLLLDERDEGVLTAIAVTPVPPPTFMLYRISAPLLLGAVMTIVSYPLMGLAPLRLVDLVAVAAVASLLAPATALFLAVFAANKVSGFAMVKILNTVNIAPVAAWFIAPPWQWMAGVVPAYWPMKMVWLASAGEPYAIEAVAGGMVGAAWIVILRRKLAV